MAGGNVTPQLGPLFAQAGAANHVPASVLAGIMSVETNMGANKSTSSAGAQGDMQFMPATARQFGNDPAHNDAAAVNDAAKLLNQYGFQTNPLRAIGAYNGGPGNPQMGYARQVMSEAARLGVQLTPYLRGFGPGASKAVAVPPGAKASPDQVSVSTKTTPASTDWNAVGLAALEHASARPIKTDGSFKPENLLGELLRASSAPAFNTPASSSTTFTTTPGVKLPSGPSTGTAQGAPGGNVNPLPGWKIGRTDMGVDASTKPGDPIRAVNDSVVTHIFPNWYAHQPYVLMQITAGPDKGKYWYVSEQIDHLPSVGQHIARNDVVARFAPSGTGIEIGWGTPTWQTLAQASGNTGDASHGNSPAGLDFKKHFNLR